MIILDAAIVTTSVDGAGKTVPRRRTMTPPKSPRSNVPELSKTQHDPAVATFFDSQIVPSSQYLSQQRPQSVTHVAHILSLVVVLDGSVPGVQRHTSFDGSSRLSNLTHIQKFSACFTDVAINVPFDMRILWSLLPCLVCSCALLATKCVNNRWRGRRCLPASITNINSIILTPALCDTTTPAQLL